MKKLIIVFILFWLLLGNSFAADVTVPALDTEITIAANDLFLLTKANGTSKNLAINVLINDTKGNGDTTYLWSADKVYDQLALKQNSISFGANVLNALGVDMDAVGGLMTFSALLEEIAALSKTNNTIMSVDGSGDMVLGNSIRISDSAAQFFNSVDDTKLGKINLSGNSASTTSTLAFADTADATHTVPAGTNTLVISTDAKLNRYHQTADINPDALYGERTGHEIELDPKTAAALTITEIYVRLNEDPTQELTCTVYQKAAGLDHTSPTTVAAGDTSAGVLTINSGWTDATVPAGSMIWLVIGDDPDATTLGMKISITGTYD